MAFQDDLLAQARLLIHLDKKRPKQANLKRGISAAYYALFHLLVDEACQMLVSGAPQKSLRSLLRRAFAHSEMLTAAKQFATGNVPDKLKAALTGSPSSSLVFISKTFVELQQARHEADYSAATTITRGDADTLLNRTEEAFTRWATIRSHNESKVFLASLLVWSKLRT